ncbi:MAG TPA: cellulose binding domain-containing protein [Polyangiaceae bacterium]|nr:cellulose binding domain-containing protein [Polyangiaceae bacterium]
MALGARALFGSALFLAWACAHQTGSDLGGSSSDNPTAGKGGSSAKGGTSANGGSGGSSASSTGGTSTSAGKGGTGTGGSSTGGSATGGSSTGGTATGGSGNASSSGGSGGTSGDTANGGQAGDDTIPPDVLANASVVLRYYARNASDTSNAVDTRLYLENKSDDALPMSQVKVRYWTTLEGTWGNLKCYHAGPNIGSADDVTLDVVEDGDDTHVLIGFTKGSIPAHNGSPFAESEFQMKIDAQGGSTFDQDNDWSFNGSLPEASTPPQPNGKITVYLADKLIWGCEPSGKCAGDDVGQGGQGGQGGQAGETGTGGSGTGGSVSAGQGGEPNAGQGGA